MDDGLSSPAAAGELAATRRPLIVAALCGIAIVLAGAWWLAGEPQLASEWQADARGRIELARPDSAALASRQGLPLAGVRGPDAALVPVDAQILYHSPRWLADDEARERHARMHSAVGQALAHPGATLVFADGSPIEVSLRPRGLAGLGLAFWLLSGLGLLLYLTVVVLVLSRWSALNGLFALMSLCQLANLGLAAVASAYGFGLPGVLRSVDMPLRMALDLVTAAAAVHAASLLYPPAGPGGSAPLRIALAAWAVAALLVGFAAGGVLPHAWWWTQAGVAGLCGLALVLLRRTDLGEPHVQAAHVRRIGSVGLVTWLLMTFAVATAQRLPANLQPAVEVVSTTWYVFLTAMLVLVPLFTRSRQAVREFALLAAVSTIAVSLDLLLMALFSLGQFAALTLSLFGTLAVYAASRRWVLSQLIGRTRLTTERMFEQLYRIAREVEAHPRRVPALLLQLLRELFEPAGAEPVEASAPARSRVEENGAALVVPIASLTGERVSAPVALRLRLAQHGRRRFILEDARLTDRIVEQLGRAVAFDHAVEQGRREERQRLAQDLHDDIGARLLTLMYKAPSPEIEEYVRHTLKDLKTLTRGLAASRHKLGDAAAEWKADLTQRLTAADVTLGWVFGADRELTLTVVQWSALTRIVRELASNAIAHARATHVEVALELAGNTLSLRVADDGQGGDPQTWSHGLGLGGVRKRVKQLGGEVEWVTRTPHGIECRVRLPLRPVPD